MLWIEFIPQMLWTAMIPSPRMRDAGNTKTLSRRPFSWAELQALAG